MRTRLIFTNLHSWLGSSMRLAAVGGSCGAGLGAQKSEEGAGSVFVLPVGCSGSGMSPLSLSCRSGAFSILPASFLHSQGQCSVTPKIQLLTA